MHASPNGGPYRVRWTSDDRFVELWHPDHDLPAMVVRASGWPGDPWAFVMDVARNLNTTEVTDA